MVQFLVTTIPWQRFPLTAPLLLEPGVALRYE
jgi:hypothetical protein